MEYTDLVKRFEPLANQDHSTRYQQGDLLVEGRPLPAELQKLAGQFGYNVNTLRDRMLVAEAFPVGHKIRKIPWTIAKALLVLEDAEQRETVLNSRPLREWSVNSIGHAVRRYQEEHGMRRPRPGGLADLLIIPGFGRITVKDAKDGGKIVEILAEHEVSGKIRAQDCPNELRIVVS
jgi:hypothetical protein